jgi:hypothetical protein
MIYIVSSLPVALVSYYIRNRFFLLSKLNHNNNNNMFNSHLNLIDIRNLRMKMDRRPILKQFKAPIAWTKLQEVSFIQTQQLGQRDTRCDCVINSLAFVGAMKRELAEETSKMVNDRKQGITTTEIAEYFEGNDGYEKNPHGTVGINTLAGVYETYAELKENMVALIGINRANGPGHSATVVRLGGELMVFDAQLETLTPNIGDWLILENASSVDVVLKLDKRVHRRDETHVGIKRNAETNDKIKRQKVEEPPPVWKARNLEKSRRLKRVQASVDFVKEMTHIGFANWLV